MKNIAMNKKKNQKNHSSSQALPVTISHLITISHETDRTCCLPQCCKGSLQRDMLELYSDSRMWKKK